MSKFILTNKYFKCKQFRHIKNTTDQIESLLKQNINYYTKFLQLSVPSLTYTATLIRTLDHFPALVSENTYRSLKHAIRSSKKLNPYSCCLIAKYFKQFSFEGDQTDILKLLRDFTIINKYHFTPKQIDEFTLSFKGLILQKAQGPVQFIEIPNINKIQMDLDSQKLMLLNEVPNDPKLTRNVVIDEKNSKISYQRKSTKQKSQQWVKIKIIGIPTKEIKKVQNKRLFGLSQYQYNQQIQKIMAKFIFQFKKAISHNSQAVIFETSQSSLDQDFHANQFKKSQFYSHIQLYPLRFTTQEVQNYLLNFKKTFGVVYSQILTNSQKQQGFIDPMRSLLLHLNDHHKAIFLVKKDSRKQVLRHFFDIKRYPFQAMEKIFTYYRMIGIQQLAHFCVNRQNQGCLPLPKNNKKTLNKQPSCMQRQRIKLKSLKDINQQESKQKFFMNEADILGQQLEGIIKLGQIQGLSSFVIVCDSAKIWNIFQALCNDKKQQKPTKVQEMIGDKQAIGQNLNQRLGMLKSIYAEQDSFADLTGIEDNQVQLFRQSYNKLLYPLELKCD